MMTNLLLAGAVPAQAPEDKAARQQCAHFGRPGTLPSFPGANIAIFAHLTGRDGKRTEKNHA